MARVGLDTDPGSRVRCMFCLETVPEVEYPGHVFHHHRITGLYTGAEGPGGCQHSQHVQTGEDEEILLGDDNKHSDKNLSTASEAESMAIEPESEARPSDHEDDDGEESDFELDCQCSFCLHADMDHDDTSVADNPSLDLQETQPDDTLSIPTEMAIKTRHESSESTPKKVTFANITNYYPVKKLGWLERLKIRGGKNVKSQILGPDTTLRYLKYWGSSKKPPARPSNMRKRTRKKNCDIDAESVGSLRSIGVAVVWHCPKDGCQFTGKNILSVRKHFSSHFPSM